MSNEPKLMPEIAYQSDLFEKLAHWHIVHAEATYETPQDLARMLREAARWQRRLAASCERAHKQIHKLIDQLEEPRPWWRRLVFWK